MPPETDLATVDIDGVEILSAGGPFHGQGSPKGGDYFTADFLKQLADANGALVDLRPRIKIGHNTAQKLLTEELPGDEMPAAGWLQNVRVGERDGVAKLLADLKGVPRKLAELVKAGAFPTRSVEMGRVYAQTGDQAGKKLTAITALALLGAKAPAVRTLDDIVALYADEGIEAFEEDDLHEVVFTDAREVVEGEMTATLPPELRALAGIETEEAVIPYRRLGDEIELSDYANWRKKERVMGTEGAADTPGMKIKDLSDEQVRALATTLGLGEEVEGDELRTAVADTMTDLLGEEKPVTPEPDDSSVVKLSQAEVAELRANAALAASLAEERRIERRDGVVNGAVDAGKVPPAEAETWRSLYDANPEATTKALTEMPVNDELVRALGDEGGGEGGDTAQAEEDELFREFAGHLGIQGEEA